MLYMCMCMCNARAQRAVTPGTSEHVTWTPCFHGPSHLPIFFNAVRWLTHSGSFGPDAEGSGEGRVSTVPASQRSRHPYNPYGAVMQQAPYSVSAAWDSRKLSL